MYNNFRPPMPVTPNFPSPTATPLTNIPTFSNTEGIEEETILGERFTTIFVGSLHESVPDDVIFRVLQVGKSIYTIQACGPVKKWNRVKDPTGTPKAFGFCEYLSADGVLRCLRLLETLKFYDKQIMLRVDEKSKNYLERYKEWKTRQGEPIQDEEKDNDSLKSIRNILKNHSLSFSFTLKEDKAQALLNEISEAAAQSDSPKEPLNDHVKEEDQKEGHDDQHRKKRERDFIDRLRRWESKESGILRGIERDEEREMQRKDRLIKKREEDLKYFSYFDDDKDDAEFYRDRSRWVSKRKRDLVRESEYDMEDRRLEQEELRRQSQVPEQSNELNSAEISPMETDEVSNIPQEEPEPLNELNEPNPEISNPVIGAIKVGFGLTSKQSSSESMASKKRSRPTAVEAFGDVESDEEIEQKVVETFIPIHKRLRLMPIEYSVDELMADGYSKSEAEKKVLENEKHRAQRLVQEIPVDKIDLFKYQISWDVLDKNLISLKVKPWLNKKINELFGSSNEQFESIIIKSLLNKENPDILIKEISNEIEFSNAELFVVRLWRFIIFETEYKLLGKK
ncbi:hypothetical protein ROZALSC1DRAFT_26822 [Rozella allomycis CSF55]|uniref:PWI domain-containing protein n=1 Tax=Rozella allomycis (strain CSF55) TaxID=988480 RepID=A0A4P9YQE6_ROZAC|nr:hypothetical protein ROZALSC1DRAFT_26822 [Rozella allomycis CSF55]